MKESIPVPFVPVYSVQLLYLPIYSSLSDMCLNFSSQLNASDAMLISLMRSWRIFVVVLAWVLYCPLCACTSSEPCINAAAIHSPQRMNPI